MWVSPAALAAPGESPSTAPAGAARSLDWVLADFIYLRILHHRPSQDGEGDSPHIPTRSYFITTIN
jgi:hypothetical protein